MLIPDNLNAISCILIRGRQREFETDPHRGESHVKTEAETGVMRPQAEEACSHQKLEEASQNTNRPVASLREFKGSFAICFSTGLTPTPSVCLGKL